MNTEEHCKYRTSFIFKGLDSLERQDSFVENCISERWFQLPPPPVLFHVHTNHNIALYR